jgi:hypothetical protein
MRKLPITPLQAGYDATPGNEALSVALAGGPSRTRRDFIGAVAIVNAEWVLTPFEQQYMQAFFRTATTHATEPFLIDLVLDDFPLQEYQVKFVPGTFRITGVTGGSTSCAAQLEVVPLPDDAAYDNSVMDSYESYGDDASSTYDLLAHFVNVDLPNDIPA